MAEYKYRALGWKDDDIASLNVVGGTAADNQVELQITKQGAGGTIDGPAIVGKDGITIDKAADSEKIEISGSGCVQKDTSPFIVYGTDGNGDALNRRLTANPVPNAIVQYDNSGKLSTSTPINDLDCTNKKYVDDNYVKKDTTPARVIYAHDGNGNPIMLYPQTRAEANEWWIPTYRFNTEGDSITGNAVLLTNTPIKPYQCANKKYVDEADKNLRLKLSNLEQTLNGYILDTTKETYADLDSAVLKNSVAVGDNVYPIADKTRALVSRIEGKTTKMVQVLDKSTFPATSTPTAGVTVTKTDDGGLHVLGTAASSGGRNSWGITVNVEKGHKYLSLLKGNNKITTPYVTLKSDTSQYVGFVADIATSTIEGECYYGFNFAAEDYDETIYPQLFDLTAMNREDITTAEQFKAEFPEFYQYENGNIYPAKISGVKFTGKNLLDFKTVSAMKGNPMGISYSVVGNEVHIVGTLTQLGSVNIIKTSNLGLVGHGYKITVFDIRGASAPSSVVLYGLRDVDIYGDIALNITSSGMEVGQHYDFYFKVMVSAITPTAYEPYTEPVSVTLPETYDLHGIGNYKDYLEITKNEDNELYTLKKVQNVGVYEYTGNEAWTVGDDNFTSVFRYYCTDIMIPQTLGDKGICNKYATLTAAKDEEGVLFGLSNNFIYLFLNKTNFPDINSVKSYLSAQYAENNPVVIYYRLSSPVETVIATNFTYEQVTAVRHNGGLIEVEGNTNKGYAKPTVTNTIVYRLTASTTVDGTSIVKDTDGKIQLNQEYIDYLDNQLYQPPAISVFTMLDAAGAALPTSNELGTTLSAASFNHQETNIKNIQGDNVELHINNAVAATTSTAKKDVATKVTLTTAQSITSSTKFTLKGTNTKGAAFSRDYQVNFYRYAYTATTDATTAPTSGATQQAAVSTFASNGSTFNYTKGAYIYFYTDNTGKKVQTNVLGQWADVDTTDMGKVTLTQSNGATHEYTCYRIGPFIETGSAKYRV